MKSIAFPEMFTTSGTNIVEDAEATISNMKLLLASWKKSLIGQSKDTLDDLKQS